MSIWKRIETIIATAGRATFGALVDRIAAEKQRRDEAAFSIALIALSAKMAKADGIVTDDEFAAFLDFFNFPEDEGDRVRMVYRLAQQDVAGFDEYITRIAKLFEEDQAVLEDVLDCLFHIALADGVTHPDEIALLDRAAQGFAISEAAYSRLKAAHLGAADDDPYLVLGVDHRAPFDEIRRAYRTLVREHHPDAMIARGVPAGLIRIGEGRMAAINAAYDKIAASFEPAI